MYRTFLLLLIVNVAFAQDPHLPPGNLGITNMQDGNAPAPGWYYMQYVQVYQSGKTKDGAGLTISGAPAISSMLAMQQVVFISNARLLDANAGFTVIVPLVK